MAVSRIPFGALPVPTPSSGCGCSRCLAEAAEKIEDPLAAMMHTQVFVVCSSCGNKRCPKATDHRLECTGSNDPGQPGSRFEFQGAPKPLTTGDLAVHVATGIEIQVLGTTPCPDEDCDKPCVVFLDPETAELDTLHAEDFARI